LRIATYNVHYFTDVDEKKNTYEEVMKDIETINADIFILQEVIVGAGLVQIKPNLFVEISTLYTRLDNMGYTKIILCNSVPSWYKAIYGNLLLINKRLVDKCGSDDLICKKYDETIFTFNKSTTTTVVSGSHEGTKETRCYIYVKIPFEDLNLHIYGTHLDVASEKTRMEQAMHIVKIINSTHTQANDVGIIMGDFNTIDREQYQRENNQEILQNKFLAQSGEVVKTLKTLNFHDMSADDPLKMTTWNNTRVDFIFSKPAFKRGTYIAEKYFTKASDHLPVIVTLKRKVSTEPLIENI